MERPTSYEIEARTSWSTRLGFILASVGCAVGIGNIWRFPAVVGQNGGGAYLIPYAISILAFALPLMVLELAVGRQFRATLVSAAHSIRSRLTIAGWLVYTIVFSILSYYLVITGWTLAFLVFSVAGADTTFGDFTSGFSPLLFFGISAVSTGLIVSLGVRRGIERMTLVVMPLAAVILLLLVGYSATLSGFGEGAQYFLEPDLSVLDSPTLWSAAVGQAFFSLSVGFGVLLVYASYLDRETDLVKSAWFIAIADVSVALLAGMVIFPIVFTYGLEPTLGAELAFTTLPAAFDRMPGGDVVAPAFFLLIFMAAMTSAVSMLEANVAAVMESTGLGRLPTTAVLTAAVLVLGLPAALSYSDVGLSIADKRILDVMDETLGTLGLPLGALLTVIVFRWFLSTDVLAAQLQGGFAVRMLSPLTKYVLPVVLISIIASSTVSTAEFVGWQLLPDRVVFGALTRDLVLIGLLPALLFSTLAVVSILRWWAVRFRRPPSSADTGTAT